MSDSEKPQAAAQQMGVAALFHDAGAATDRHSVIWVRGADAVSFLDGLVSQSVASAETTLVRRSFLLTPQGKMRAFLWVLGGVADRVGLITQRTTEETVVADLSRFRFRVDADISVDPGPVATLVGPGSAQVLQTAGLEYPESGWVMQADGIAAAVPFTRGGPERIVLTGDAARAVVATASVVDDHTYEAARIALGEALGNVDFDAGTISHELGPVDAAVDFTKGCYLGQELVARIDSRGRVNQTLRIVEVAGSVALAGVRLTAGDREVGTVTSATPLYGGQITVGLARIRHEVEDGATITALVGAAPVEATVKAIGNPT